MDFKTFNEFLTVLDGKVNYDFDTGLRRTNIFPLKAEINVFERVMKLGQPAEALILKLFDKAKLYDRNRILHTISYKVYIKYHVDNAYLICSYNATTCNTCYYKHHNNAGSFEVRIIDLHVMWSTLAMNQINAEIITTLCKPIHTLCTVFLKVRPLKIISDDEYITLRELVQTDLENWGFICRTKKAIVLYLMHYKPRHIGIIIYPTGEIETCINLSHLPKDIMDRIRDFAACIGIYFEFSHVLSAKKITP